MPQRALPATAGQRGFRRFVRVALTDDGREGAFRPFVSVTLTDDGREAAFRPYALTQDTASASEALPRRPSPITRRVPHARARAVCAV